MFWKKKKPSLEGEERYLNKEGDPHDPWDSVKELEYLLSSPYVKFEMLDTELFYKSAYLLLLLREYEERARSHAELNGGISHLLENVEKQLAVVDEALRDISLFDYRVDEGYLNSHKSLDTLIHTHFDKKW